MGGGAWWAAVHGVRKSRTQLNDFSLSCSGEGNGSPLQYSCLENPRDGSLVGCRLWGRTESDTIGVTWRQQQHKPVCMLSHFSHIQLCAILRTVAHQAPLSKEFSRQEYWSGLPCPPPGDLPDPGIKPVSLTPLALAGRFFTTSTTWEASISLGGQQTVELLYHLLWKSQGRARAEAVLGFGALREPEALVEHGNILTATSPQELAQAAMATPGRKSILHLLHPELHH